MTVLFDAAAKREMVVNGKYNIVTSDGEKVKYQRASTFASITEDRYNLDIWRINTALKGLADSPDLLLRYHSMTDPSYSEMHELSEACLDRAGANEGRNLGTGWHNLVEQFVRGKALEEFMPEHQPRIQAFASAVTEAGIKFTEHLEVPIAVTSLKVAGRFDYVVELADGRRCIADLKTSKSITGSGLSFATQLALYAMHDATIDPETFVMGPKVEDINQDIGLIIWLPARSEEAICEISKVRLSGPGGGFDAVMLAQELKEARNFSRRKTGDDPLVSPYTPLLPSPNPRGEGSPSDADTSPSASDVAPSYSVEPALEPESKIDELRIRFQAVVDLGHKDALRVAWHARAVPRISKDSHTPEEMESICAAISEVEGMIGAPFQSPYVEPKPDLSDQNSRIASLPKDLRNGLHPSEDTETLEQRELIHAERKSMITQALSGLTESAASSIAAAVVTRAEYMTAKQADQVFALSMAIQADVLNDDLELTSVPDIFESKRQALNVGRSVAREYDLESPKNSDDVLSNPFLVALSMRQIISDE